MTAVHDPAATLPSTVQQLWGHWEARHGGHPQYGHWRTDAVPARMTRRIGGGDTFVRTEPGDLVLVHSDIDGLAMRATRHAYCPRVGGNVAVRYGDYTPLETEDTP
ncbi:hypothetical protein DVS28_b0176 (plasmid) [Euzebya pacifica]|uniref:Uncharacterized protein n=1 Tax=Euzebya pacifica TaxID=1608957 RepID=A0A346Y649_9ACTN|nr:hypothetical protein [Euzebya pacifica]AXV09946.1 hypothetical protein DVS28_b0176 [Euzebya pacifica]